jgi:energy-coupling factor transport system permease protein
MRPYEDQLDSRAWLLWFVAASLPALLGRNPWPLVATLIAVTGVRIAWSDRMRGGQTWALYLRLALVFALVGTAFNVLTVRAGDRVLISLPGAIPVAGGEVTLNAAVYGLLGGIALVLLVLLGSTVAGLLDWAEIVRLMPDGLTTIAVAGSIAFAFLPQTAIALRDIREAQMARGHRVRGARDLLPIIVPVLAGGLERAVTLSESLESRGFGAPSAANAASARWAGYAGAIGLAAGALGAFALATGQTRIALPALAFAVLMLVPLVRAGSTRQVARTRYRQPTWTVRDSAVAVVSVVAILTTLFVLNRSPESIRYEPYPRLMTPQIDPLLIAAILGLLLPAFLAPAPPKAGTT